MAEIVDDSHSLSASGLTAASATFNDNTIDTSGVNDGTIKLKPGSKYSVKAGDTLEKVTGTFSVIEYDGNEYKLKTAQKFAGKAKLSMSGPSDHEITISADDDKEKEAVYINRKS